MKEGKKKKWQAEDDVPVTGTSEDQPLSQGSLIAKKDFEIHHNEYRRKIKAGEDLSDVPEMYLANLRTEGVL